MVSNPASSFIPRSHKACRGNSRTLLHVLMVLIFSAVSATNDTLWHIGSFTRIVGINYEIGSHGRETVRRPSL